MKKPLLLFSIICLNALASSPHPSLPTPGATDGLGVNIHFTHPRAGEMEQLAAAGFRWVRMDFHWGGTERELGKYDFAAYDHLLAALEAHKMHAIFILDYGNKLYKSDGNVTTEESRQAFARWAAAATTHFKGHGIVWEIWNEPNIGFWKPKPNVDEYSALALDASKAIRAAAPGEAIVGAATSGVDLKFLEACFKAGLLELWDAVSVHPYRQSGPETAETDYRKLRRLIAQYAPKDKALPILSGEWGYSSVWGHFDADAQGRMLIRQWLTNLANGIPISIWYDWHDDGKDPKEAEHHFGTVLNDYHAGRDLVYDPKPSYLAAKTLTTFLAGCKFEKRIDMPSEQDHALLFSKGDELRLAVWTIGGTEHQIHIPSNECPFEITSHLGEALNPLEAKDGHLLVNATDAPQFFVAKGRHNSALANAAPARPLRITFIPTPDKVILVRVENVSESPLTFKFTLKPYEGIQPTQMEQPVEFKEGESEKTLCFALAAPASPEGFRIGAYVLKSNMNQELPVQMFNPVSNELWKTGALHGDGDAKVKSVQTLELAPPPEPLHGSIAPVWRLNYFFDDGWKFLQLDYRGSADKKMISKPRAVGMWIYGDGQHTLVRLRFNDSAQQTWQPSGQEIDWKGWRYVQMDIDRTAGHWGGKNDGVMHYPLQWQTLFLLDNPSKKQKEGTLFIAAPQLIY